MPGARSRLTHSSSVNALSILVLVTIIIRIPCRVLLSIGLIPSVYLVWAHACP